MLVVLEEAAAIKNLAAEGRDELAAPLRFGTIYTIGPYLLPDLVRQAIGVLKREMSANPVFPMELPEDES